MHLEFSYLNMAVKKVKKINTKKKNEDGNDGTLFSPRGEVPEHLHSCKYTHHVSSFVAHVFIKKNIGACCVRVCVCVSQAHSDTQTAKET